MEEPVSVIVTVYNGEAYLGECLDSILGQTYKAFELIVVDDGSTDRSGSICDEYADKDDRIRVIHQQNTGLMMARAAGARSSRGLYLMFVDSDDTIEATMLEAMTKKLISLPLFSGVPSGTISKEKPDWADRQIICCNYVIDREWNHTQEKVRCTADPGEYTGERLEKEIKEKILGNENRTVILSMCMKLFSRQLVLDNLHYALPGIRMGEDVCRSVPAILDADRIAILEDAYYYHYRFVKSSMVHHYDSGLRANMQQVAGILEQALIDRRREALLPALQKEEVYFYFLILKNEIRRRDIPGKEVVKRIRKLCLEDHSRTMITCIPQPSQMANRLLSIVMKHPTRPVIAAVRRIFLARG